MWPLLADALNRDVLSKEALFGSWYTPLLALAFAGFVSAVIGHIVQSRTTIACGIALIFVAVMLFPIFLYVRGHP